MFLKAHVLGSNIPVKTNLEHQQLTKDECRLSPSDLADPLTYIYNLETTAEPHQQVCRGNNQSHSESF